MPDPLELKFQIKAYSKATFPLWRLGKYLTELGVLLGERGSVHFDRVEDGSAIPVAHVEHEAAPRVLKRIHAVRIGEGSPEARSAKQKIEKYLVEDNADGADLLHSDGAKILPFKGRSSLQEVYGPVRQYGELTGNVIVIGGKNETVPVHLEDGDRIHICEAKRDLAIRLAKHLFRDTIRVVGFGRWSRSDAGEWELDDFKISDFTPLKDAPLSAVVDELRSVRSKWLDGSDPLGELRRSRQDQ